MIYLILILYITITFLGSLAGAKKTNSTPDGYFLANRDVTTLTLFFTILATNFSAFYFLGFAGEGYRIGYAYYVVMAFGTAFACLSFFLIGTKTWRLGKQNSLVTPSELIYYQSKSRPLALLYGLVMIVFTFPYLALQIVGAGYILETLTGGDIPYLLGATLLTVFTIVYVFIGGMSSVAKTDLKQGLLAFILMFLAVVVISSKLGGLEIIHQKVQSFQPTLFERTGANNFYTPQKWFSLLIFWIFCIPMFPQIFMRFYMARDLKHLKQSAFLYGFIPLFVSILPVMIGIMGHLSFPDLEGRAADQILPMMLVEHTPGWFAALVMTGALAAFMSTLDSQLLALSTILTRDFYVPFSKKSPDFKKQIQIGRVGVIILAVIGLLIAWQPFDTIFDMGKLAFSGLSVLFPITLALLHWKKVSPLAGIISIVIGELLLLLFYYGGLPSSLLMGFEAAIIVLIICFGIVFLGKIFQKQ